MSEDEQPEVRDVPDYRIRHVEMSEDMLEKLVIVVNECMQKQGYEKECCVNIVAKLKLMEEFEDSGQGEWQCIIGKNFASALTFDAGLIAFFDILEHQKSVLIFKS
jgi:hypothetical protein